MVGSDDSTQDRVEWWRDFRGPKFLDTLPFVHKKCPYWIISECPLYNFPHPSKSAAPALVLKCDWNLSTCLEILSSDPSCLFNLTKDFKCFKVYYTMSGNLWSTAHKKKGEKKNLASWFWNVGQANRLDYSGYSFIVCHMSQCRWFLFFFFVWHHKNLSIRLQSVIRSFVICRFRSEVDKYTLEVRLSLICTTLIFRDLKRTTVSRAIFFRVGYRRCNSYVVLKIVVDF